MSKKGCQRAVASSRADLTVFAAIRGTKQVPRASLSGFIPGPSETISSVIILTLPHSIVGITGLTQVISRSRKVKG